MHLMAAEKMSQFQKRLKEKGLAEEMKNRDGKNKKHQSVTPTELKV